ncbi:MAG TPA: RDD family protein [Methylotenera sp.]
MEWFISKDGKQENGFDTQQLRNMIENGELLNSDLAWKQGMEDWVMIRDVPELSSPPPLPQTEGQTQAGDAPPPLPATGSHGTEIIYAGFLKRMAALFLDGIVLTIFSIPIYLISGLVSMAGNKEASIFIHFLLVVILSATYFTRMESSESSATYGKRWMGLKALDADGQRLSTANAFARWALHILSYITLYIGFFIQPFTARRQALHDIIANTIVVERTENKPSPFFVKWMIGVSSFLVALTIVGVIAAIAIPAYQNYKLKHSIVDPFSDPKLGGEKETQKNLTDADVGLDNPALNGLPILC